MLLPLVAASLMGPVRLIPFFPNHEFPEKGKEEVITYENIDPQMPFDEVVPSWNVESAKGAVLEVQIRSHGDDYTSKWYTFGKWTLEEPSMRTSVKNQKDDHGNVDTDTFEPVGRPKSIDIQIHLRNEGDGPRPKLKLFTVSFSNFRDHLESPNFPSPAWGKTIEVPQRAQGNYPNGGVLCSPTSLSMVLWHYANQLNRPELNRDVPEVESHVWDKSYDGAGNWPFNAAYAGSFPGMRAYISRFKSIVDLETWIDAGYPVICSISLHIAEGEIANNGSGHLVVLVGFTKDGDPVFNDPARKAQVRYTYKRENFERAWLFSHRTVYLVYPEDAAVPKDLEHIWISGP